MYPRAAAGDLLTAVAVTVNAVGLFHSLPTCTYICKIRHLALIGTHYISPIL